jgi:hypothetical protein
MLGPVALVTFLADPAFEMAFERFPRHELVLSKCPDVYAVLSLHAPFLPSLHEGLSLRKSLRGFMPLLVLGRGLGLQEVQTAPSSHQYTLQQIGLRPKRRAVADKCATLALRLGRESWQRHGSKRGYQQETAHPSPPIAPNLS